MDFCAASKLLKPFDSNPCLSLAWKRSAVAAVLSVSAAAVRMVLISLATASISACVGGSIFAFPAACGEGTAAFTMPLSFT
ncbi:hypothetical protein ACLQ2J_33955 [Streptomyces cyaneofuscatus]|uniref:hypothetical protein n=1 Tax=Streptomyces cyaneofuscatus TaxID=66883 RepID=UPI003CF0791F